MELSPDPREAASRARGEQLRERFEKERGYWNPFWEDLLALDPDYFEAYIDFSGHPWRDGVLPDKAKELVYTALDASTTHLFAPGLTQHIRNALSYGAEVGEVLDVLEIVSGLGIQSCVVGLPVVLQETGSDVASGDPDTEPAGSPVPGELGWTLAQLSTIDGAFASAYSALMAVPTRRARLDPKLREFIQLAINCSPTHLNVSAVREHVRAAVRHGATRAELVEVLELCSGLGIHTCLVGLPILLSEAEMKRQSDSDQTDIQ